MTATELLRVENLQVHFTLYSGQLRRREAGIVRAVNGLGFTVRQGETLALVGAAGCGKTTVARALALLEQPSEGRIFFEGQELTAWRGRHFKRARRRIQMLFSNPYVAFAPRMTVEQIIVEALGLRRRREERLADLMAQVGLNLYLSLRFPRDLSGGQRQRLVVARVLATEPSLLVCDQPAHYLDLAMGEVIIDLLHELNQRLGLTMLLTTRRLELARHAHRVAVMVLGRIVEMGYYADLVRQPLHPFTQALLRPPSAGLTDVTNRALDPLHPPAIALPPGAKRRETGCYYEPLCPLAEARCRDRFPAFVEGAPNHGVACHLVEPV